MQRCAEPLPANHTVFAPGKLVIGGEYAVIDGGPAIVMAIDRGVKCTITQGNGLITPDGDTRFVQRQLHALSSTLRYQFSNWNSIDLQQKLVLVVLQQHVLQPVLQPDCPPRMR